MRHFKRIEPGMVVTVGTAFAAQMDYEAAAGQNAVVLNMEEAVSQVSLLTSNSGEIGAHYEIHNDDLVYEHDNPEGSYVFVDMSTGHIYHTKDKGLYEFAPTFMGIRAIKFFKNIKHVHTILDEYNGEDALNNKPYSTNKEILSCMVFCLDDENSAMTGVIKSAYEKHKAHSSRG